ncbi:MAG TPA: hypothetical protein VHK88_14795 [Aquihabitans sp.]|jgi:hypothetical protein|nr:hypothetical protein [Aquihabitans sp.]
MFAAHCAAEGRTVLLSERRITGLDVAPDQVTISFRCWCGADGRVVDRRGTGPVAQATPTAVAAPPTGVPAPEEEAPAPTPAHSRHREPAVA